MAPRRYWTSLLATPNGPAFYFPLFFALAACALLTPPLIEAWQFIPRAYNEGWNAYHAFSALQGLPLYPQAGDGLANNYPPLSFVLIALISKLTGNSDVIFVGRFVAVAALLLVIGLLYSILRAGQVRTWLAAAVALAVLCIICSTTSIYVAVNDPQWLAQALSLAGAAVLLRRPTSAGVLGASAALMLAGGFVKNVVLAIPSAVALWLLLKDRLALLKWMAFVCLILGVALALCWWAYGADFFHSLLGTPRVFSVTLAFENVYAWRYAIFPGFLAGAVSVVYLCHRRRASDIETFAILYFAWSLLWLAPMLCGAGIWFNSLFEPLVACALLTGFALELALRQELSIGRSPLKVAHLALALLAAVITYLSAKELMTASEKLQTLAQRKTDTQIVLQRLAQTQAPVACESLALCFWAGKKVEFDFFNRGQSMTLNPEVLQSDLADIEREKYDIIQLNRRDKLASYRFPEPINQAIERHYRVERKVTLGTLAVRIHPQ